MKAHKFLKVSLAVLVVFLACNQSRALQTDNNPDLRQMAQGLASGSADASLPAQCTAPNVYHYDLPVYWGQPDSPKFTYYFQIQAAAVSPETAPIGIVLPGGAGAPSIGYPAGAVFPPSFNVIYTDVRGVGCNINSANPFSSDALTTEYFSRDVLSIVQVLRLKKYVLYGVSYGTVQATVMTNIAQNEGIQTPSALVLEGIIGNWQTNSQKSADYNSEWTRTKALLPTSVADSFAQTPLPLDLSGADWYTFLFHTLNAGTTPQWGNNTVHYLAPLGSSDPGVVAQAKTDIQNTLAAIKANFTPETTRVSTTLACTETAGNVHTTELVNGEIVQTSADLCPQLGLSFVKPYDSAQYPAKVPIYYFEGSDDPDTIPAGAAYHFNNQTQTNRVFILVWGGGHTDMSGTLHDTGCTPAIFTAIATAPSGLGAALQQCHWPMSLAVRLAGQ